MEARTFGRSDYIGRGTSAMGFRDFNVAIDVERGRHAIERDARLRECALAEIAVGDGDAQTVHAVLEKGNSGLDRANGACRVFGIVTLHCVVDEGEIARRACEWSHVIEARD